MICGYIHLVMGQSTSTKLHLDLGDRCGIIGKVLYDECSVRGSIPGRNALMVPYLTSFRSIFQCFKIRGIMVVSSGEISSESCTGSTCITGYLESWPLSEKEENATSR